MIDIQIIRTAVQERKALLTTHYEGCEYNHYPCAVLKLCDELDKFKPIPVTEKMPPAREYVMLYDSINEQWTIGELIDSQSPQWSTIDRVYYHGNSFREITHWMPLPEDPHETS